MLLSHLIYGSLSKLSLNWIWNTPLNSENKFKKLAVVVHFLRTTRNVSRCCLAEDGKEMYEELLRAQPLYCLYKPFV